MIDNEDDFPSEYTPDGENNKNASEFNPYENPYQSSTGFVPDDEDTSGISSEDGRFTRKSNSATDNSEEIEVQETSLPDFLSAIGENSDSKENPRFSDSEEKKPSSEKKEYKAETVDYGKMNTESFSHDDNPHFNDSTSEGTQNRFTTHEEDDEDSNGNNSSNNSNESGNNNGNFGDTFDQQEDVGFKRKMSATDADKNPKSKPKVLNKKTILAAIVILFGSVFMITFLMPTGKKSKSKNEKPVAERHQSTDYSSLAKRQEQPAVQDHYEDRNVNETPVQKKNEEVEIPPVIQKNEKEPYNPNTINYNSGKGGGASSSTVEIPDTRNDSLHGKQISGIKGLTSTQQSYSTDYQQTIARNTTQSNPGSSFSMPTKEEYMSNIMGAYSQAYGNATSGNNAYNVQNDQAGKNSFFNNGRQGSDVGQGQFLNLNTLWQGTIFEAVLTSEMNTDLPGEITARITKNIYNSQDGRYLLIPQNSVVYGTYNSSISYSQSRVQVAWHTLIRPDGYQIQLGNMNGTDAKGASGLKGFVNDHPLAYLKAIGLMSVFSIINSEFTSQMGQTQNEYVQQLMANSQNVTMELGDKLIDRAMNVQPTIKIKSGTKINIVVNQNLSLPPCEDIEVTQPYHRQ